MKRLLIIAIIILVLAGLIIGSYFLYTKYWIKPSSSTSGSSAVTPPSSSTTSSKKGTLYIGIMVHLEGWNDEGKQDIFKRHAEYVRDYASLFEKYGAKLTLESSPEFTTGCIKWKDNVLKEMSDRGHGIGVHADVGAKTESYGDFVSQISQMKKELESLNITVRHTSGICSPLDWVNAAVDAGYKFVTGTIGYCAMSLPESERPSQYKNCSNPVVCHGVMPLDLKDRIHPWRAESGKNWIYDNKNGKLVILTESGGLIDMAEEGEGKIATKSSRRSNKNKAKEEFTKEDITAYISELEKAIDLAESGKVNIFYVSWSLGSALDKSTLEEWLKAIKPYVDAGKVQWKTLPEMYDAYITKEK